MINNNLNYKEYVKLVGGFYFLKFDVDKWVVVIKVFGVKYICFIICYYEGFLMFDIKYFDYNIVKVIFFKCDVVKELVDVCVKYGIKFYFYYLYIDWYCEDVFQGRIGCRIGCFNLKGDWKSYYQFMNNQLIELLINYGLIGVIWFDGWWDQDINFDFDWEFFE